MNKKIAHPKPIKGFISRSLLTEKLELFASKESDSKNPDHLARSLVSNYKVYLKKNDLSNAIIREGDRGKEQFKIEPLKKWMAGRTTFFKHFKF